MRCSKLVFIIPRGTLNCIMCYHADRCAVCIVASNPQRPSSFLSACIARPTPVLCPCVFHWNAEETHTPLGEQYSTNMTCNLCSIWVQKDRGTRMGRLKMGCQGNRYWSNIWPINPLQKNSYPQCNLPIRKRRRGLLGSILEKLYLSTPSSPMPSDFLPVREIFLVYVSTSSHFPHRKISWSSRRQHWISLLKRLTETYINRWGDD